MKYAACKTTTLDPRTGLQDLREMKSIIHCQRIGVAAGPACFPANPNQLRESHPEIWQRCYSEEQPCPSKAQRTDLARLEYLLACRSTKSGCSDLPPTRAKTAVFDSTASIGEALVDALIARQIVGPPSTPPRRQPTLALMDMDRVVPKENVEGRFFLSMRSTPASRPRIRRQLW